MDRQIAFILAGACVALGVGGYLMSESMGEYDLDRSSRERTARVEKLDQAEKPSLFAALLQKASSKMELARNQYMGEYLPETPKGWKIEKTHHDEIVDFTTDYQLAMGINDMSSVRRLAGWGSSTGERSTDVKFTKDDKIIFMRLVFDKRKRKKPIGTSGAWMFGGDGRKAEPVEIAGVYFDRRTYGDHPLVNIAAPISANAAIGVFSNTSLGDVEKLLAGMDVAGFASAGPRTNKNGGGLVVARQNKDMQTLDMQDTGTQTAVRRKPKPSPKGNLMDNLGEDTSEEGEVVVEKKEKKSRNLLSSLLERAGSGGGSSGKSKERSSGGFAKVGSFTSRCKSGVGAKVCRVGE